MYLCEGGYVTTGIGNKLGSAKEAMALPWQHKATGLPATSGEIRAAFHHISALTVEFRSQDPKAPNPFGAKHYEHASDLVLPKGIADQLAADRLMKDFLPGLRNLFPHFDAFPVPAQRALVDMAYTLGVKGLATKFKTVVSACNGGDFDTAAKYCHRKAKGHGRKDDERNVWTANLFREAERLKNLVPSIAKEIRP
jgi:GH24 family phage-related lysozyme (muramidase)